VLRGLGPQVLPLCLSVAALQACRCPGFGRWQIVSLLKLGALAGSRWRCLSFFRLVGTVVCTPYLFAHQRRLTGRSR
jgi:hypothetical protein